YRINRSSHVRGSHDETRAPKATGQERPLETLIERLGIANPATVRLSQVVHDLDMDGRSARCAGVRSRGTSEAIDKKPQGKRSSRRRPPETSMTRAAHVPEDFLKLRGDF